MVDVSLPGGGVLHCYIPLTAMGTPPPTKARKVLKKGEVRPFVLAGLDPPRRVAELALPIQVRPKKQREDGTAQIAPTQATRAGTKKARTGIAQAPAKKGPAPTKKAPAKKGAPRGKRAAAKKGPPAAKKATAKKQAKKAPSKRAKGPASTALAEEDGQSEKGGQDRRGEGARPEVGQDGGEAVHPCEEGAGQEDAQGQGVMSPRVATLAA